MRYRQLWGALFRMHLEQIGSLWSQATLRRRHGSQACGRPLRLRGISEGMAKSPLARSSIIVINGSDRNRFPLLKRLTDGDEYVKTESRRPVMRESELGDVRLSALGVRLGELGLRVHL
jgi:hypothetical protein